MSYDEIKILMSRYGLQQIPYWRYEKFDEQVEGSEILDFILATWRGVKEPTLELCDMRLAFLTAHFTGLREAFKKVHPFIDPQSEEFQKKYHEVRLRFVTNQDTHDEFSLFLVSWLYNVNVSLVRINGSVWQNRAFDTFWETDIFIFPSQKGWIYAWKCTNPTNITDEIAARSGETALHFGQAFQTQQEKLDEIRKKLETESKEQLALLEKKKEATALVKRVLKHPKEVTEFLDNLEGQKKRVPPLVKETETWLEKV